ncbi:MAG: ATP-grasp domain-containing protein [Desulfovibrionaceae bacterium]|jgi:hypothetical protein|nr:ATP-grasp domain-containing protein [Desulfovibrionaceae bacterium]
MFILDEPYASDLLLDTAERLGAPVLRTPTTAKAAQTRPLNLLDDQAFAARYAATPGARIYTNSENALGWIAAHLGHTALAKATARCKDKAAFRRALAPLHHDFAFQELALDELDDFDPARFGKPFVIKPSVGFFSIGVHVVATPDQWPAARNALRAELADVERKFPAAVIGAARCIVEEIIEGDEYAVDVYFDERGRAVVLNILRHVFSGASDVSDRIYYTSQTVLRPRLAQFTEYLGHMGALLGTRSMPLHVELRQRADGSLVPIEANPLRFAGWCTTDIARHAWGINVYETYLGNTPPDWNAIFEQRADTSQNRYSIIVADLPAGLDTARVNHIDFNKFLSHFSRPLECRPVDWKRYGVFAFVFAETTPEHATELDWITSANLAEFAVGEA